VKTGDRLGPYRILAPLGAGGMGDVYRARDTKLDRDVAIKVLPDLFSADPDRLARFEREARILASLNHPNIAHIHGLEEAGGVVGLVLELVEGSTLAAHLNGGALSIPDALRIARQIADGLEAAHEKGIIHRDLKPANVAITLDGTVKVLDFGLAKVNEGTGRADLSHSPTVMLAATRGDLILGTAAYMSPEQARGRALDKRTDIWSFGCVLYEMLTGRAAFEGETTSDLIAGILERAPDWNRLPATVPPGVLRLLRRCLEKDPQRRLHDIADARIEIDEARSEPPGSSRPGTVEASGRGERRVWLLATALLVLALMTLAGTVYFRGPPESPEMRLDIATPPTAEPVSFAISPDGRSLVFVASEGGSSGLWVRSLDSTTARPLAGTDGATYPFWSPDGRSLGAFMDDKLKRVDLAGGLPQTLATVGGGLGGTWGPDGTIVFAPTLASALARVPASGGDVAALTALSAGQSGHSFPQFLPDGRRFLFYSLGTPDAQGIYVGSLGGEAPRRLIPADGAGAYAPPGWLLSVRQAGLVARRFDPASATLSGEPVPIASPILISPMLKLGSAFSTSASGLLAYRVEGKTRRQLTWFDRSGKAVGILGPIDDQNLVDPELSPDGSRVAVTRTVEQNTDVWLSDAARTTRFTLDPGDDQFPIWSHDGTRVAFSSTRSGSMDLYQKPARGGGPEEIALASPARKVPNSWSPDGRVLLFHAPTPKAAPDMWLHWLDGDRRTSAFLNSPAPEVWGQFSPDGRWVAYQSFESGKPEIYVRPFPGPGAQWLVSGSGGIYPRWAHDGRELYYVESGGKLMAVPIRVNGTALDAGAPVALFQPPMVGGGTNAIGRRHQYDVAPDGRFLVNAVVEEAGTSPITVIVNWKPPMN
jgi:eukaryotic-like serine/threonine-protein kinase